MNTATTPKPAGKDLMPSRRIDWGRISSYGVLLLFAIIYLGPLLMLVNTSLKTLPEFMKNATAAATTLNFKNFLDAWTKASFPS